MIRIHCAWLMMRQQGKLYLQVKWKGYDDPKDLTMEPEDNLMYVTSLAVNPDFCLSQP